MVNALKRIVGKKNEKGLQLYIQRKAREAGVLCHKIESKTERGWPDLVMIAGGRVVFVEVKSPRGGVLSQAQRNVHEDIRNHGGWVVVIASEEAARALVSSLTKKQIIEDSIELSTRTKNV